MTMKDLLVHLRYPYTAGVILVIWLGSLILIMIDQKLPIVPIIIVNALTTLLLTRDSMK